VSKENKHSITPRIL